MNRGIRLACYCALFLKAGVFQAQHQSSAPAQEQGTQSAKPLSIALARQVEVTFRLHSNLPPAAEVHVGLPEPSRFPGFDKIVISYISQGNSFGPLNFLVSENGEELVQFHEIDMISKPRELVPQGERPARGGDKNAPVLIVGFDDLQCPFCAWSNATLIPAVLQRYKNQVRIVYKDYPSEGHPWAMHAAVDTDCLGSQSPDSYWTAVDEIHANADRIGGPKRELVNASHTVDSMIRTIAEKQHLDMKALNSCVDRQDTAEIDRSIRDGRALGVAATPTMFINGAKIEGAVPVDFLFKIIDSALLAQSHEPSPQPAK